MSTARNVLVIDFHKEERFAGENALFIPPAWTLEAVEEVVDCAEARRQSRDVNGVMYEPSPWWPIAERWSDCLASLSNVNLLLLHCSNPYSKALFENHCSRLPVICYSAGGKSSTWFDLVRQKASIHRYFGWHEVLSKLGAFLGAWTGKEPPWHIFDGMEKRIAFARRLLPVATLASAARKHLEEKRRSVPGGTKWWKDVREDLSSLFGDEISLDVLLRRSLPSDRRLVRKAKRILKPQERESAFFRLIAKLAEGPKSAIAARKGNAPKAKGSQELTASILRDTKKLREVEATYKKLSKLLCASEK